MVFKIDFREGVGGGERENIDRLFLVQAPTRDQLCNQGVCPD